MAGKGEKSCPICTEEMDLTDQQLKPCKCGYEICVWCWHHIMEMAQKDETEGRCPACRSPYDKDRIVAMASNCQRLVAEMNSQHKKKMQKLNLKPKSLDGRKHLCDVRVIQRNLVYIIGLPLNLADEELLQRRDYFGRYGKVLKVSISRTANGIIQHSANNSCCVYITYSKESEAVRCIQSVHCFVLEGRPLRACFGTTKYCHAWLRNVPCSNRDCLYLHDHGSHEDSFTKDELVLAFARSRVQQIIGATNNLHRRSGNVLPPPVDDPKHVTSATKLMSKSSLDKCENQIKGSASDIGAVNSSALPAVNSWVRCVSGSLSQDTSSCPGDLANRKVEASNDPQALVSRVACTESSILNTRRLEEAENGSAVHLNGSFVPSEMNKHNIGGNSQTCESNVFSEVTVEKLPGNVLSSYETPLAAFIGNDQDIVAPSVSTSFLELPRHDLNIDTSVGINSNGDVHGLCSGLSSININNHLEDSYFTPDADGLPLTHNSINSSIGQHLQQDNGHSTEHSTIPAFWEDIIVDDILHRDYEQQKISKGINYLSSGLHSTCLSQNVNQSSHQPLQQDQIYHQNHLGKTSESFNGHSETGFVKHVESKDNGTGIDSMIASDMGENNIISNILSLELDAWEGSLDKLLGESDELYKPFKAPTLRKVQDKNQSRFSFARQDDFKNEASNLQQSFEATKLDPEGNFSSGGLVGNKDTHTGRYPHVFPSGNSILSDKFVGSQFYVPSNFSMSKAHTSSPPGFSLSSRIPPGFSYGRVEQDCNSSVKHLQPQYVSPSGNTDRMGDEFNNLAVLDFGKGTMAERMNNASFDMRQTSFPQFSPREDDPRLKLLMQQSTPTQNLRVPDHVGNRFFPQNDAYRVSSRFLDQFQSNSPSIYEQIHSQEFSSNTLASNNQWPV